MRLTKERIVRAAQGCKTEAELAERLGWRGGLAEFIQLAKDTVLGLESLLKRNHYYKLAEDMARSGDHNGAKDARLKIIHYTKECALLGLLMAPAFGSPPTKKADEEKVEVKASKESVQPVVSKKSVSKAESQYGDLVPVLDIDLKHDYLHGRVRDTARKYVGNRLVCVHFPAGLFGAECFPEEKYKYYTLTNGILNQCDVSADEVVSPYWATLQGMLELEKWEDKAMLIKWVRQRYGSHRDAKRYSEEEFGQACWHAYDVLKTHTSHRTKERAGMGHMVDEHRDGQKKKSFSIRARKHTETFAYLRERKELLARAASEDVAIAAHVVRNVQ